MYEGISFGGWTVVGPYPAGGPSAHIAANAAGDEAMLRVTELADASMGDALTRAAEACGAVTHPNVAKVLAWGVVEHRPAQPVAEVPVQPVVPESVDAPVIETAPAWAAEPEPPAGPEPESEPPAPPAPPIAYAVQE
ncbi:MAG: hypothetical protein FDZ70_02530, partial [Actinobacteria bacterium]